MSSTYSIPLIHRLILTHEQQTAFENILGKGEVARNEQFLLFPHCFLLNQIIESPFVHIFDIVSLFAAELEKLNLAYQVKGYVLLLNSSYSLVTCI